MFDSPEFRTEMTYVDEFIIVLVTASRIAFPYPFKASNHLILGDYGISNIQR